MRKFLLFEIDVEEPSRVSGVAAGDAFGGGELGGVIYTMGGP